ncbi:MAG: radical SAM protein [Nitrospiraceae bacterium]|nr:MAG: radical SAM protein [Nitrospiraceae bacterium]
MRIILLNPPYFPKFSRSQRSPAVIKSGTIYYPIWLAYATGLLQKKGFDVNLIDSPAEGFDLAKTLELIEKYNPSIVVVDTSTPSIENDAMIAERIKKSIPAAYIVMVGTHVSATPEETLRDYPWVNAVARREYDETLSDIAGMFSHNKTADTEDLKKIQGLSFRSNDSIVHNADRPFITDLDQFPFVSQVYKQFLNVENYFYSITKHPEITIITGRGCPHQCTYCVYPQVQYGHRYRHRSPENVAAEFVYIRENFPHVKEVFIEDDTFTINKDFCRTVCELLIKANLGLPWTANSRADVDMETLKIMKKAGCRLLCIGVESGHQQILDNIRKKLKIEQVETFMKNARKAGILVHGCFMVGNQGETLETMEKTLRLAKRLHPDTAQFFPLMVYPGTRAFEWASEKNYIKYRTYNDWLTSEGLHNCVINTPTLSSDEMVSFCNRARRSFYLRPAYIASKLWQTVTHPSEMKRLLKSFITFSRYLFQK